MAGRGKIIIVDDEPLNREIMEEILEQDYDLHFAVSGQECLDMAPQVQPELILLDVSMPGMSGYDVCKQLKGDRRTRDIQVTFVSALDTLADRLAGYDVGGDDYITKPFDAKELLKKVQVALKSKEEQRHLQNNADAAMKTAISAITSTNEIGVVLQFLSAAFHCREYRCVAQLVIDTIGAFGYSSTVQVRAAGEEINQSSEGTINPLEVAVIKRISGEDRQIDMGSRSIINFDHISVLVKGMPVNDQDEYTRLKENIAVVAEGADMRIGAIKAQAQILDKAGLLDVMRHAQQALQQLNHQQSTHREKLDEMMQKLSGKVNESLAQFDISDVASQAIINHINETTRNVLALFEDEKALEENVTEVMDELQNAMNH
jgi:CheY-like chemotaxis protein